MPVLYEDELHRHWGWFFALGLITLILGTIALFMIPIATVVAILVLGWIMVVGGVFEVVHAFRVSGWGRVSLHLITGILGILIGLLIVSHPVAGALAWTLLFASFFTVIGVFRIVSALRLKFRHWGWMVADGVISVVLGAMLAVEWPWSGIWFLGLALGITMLFRGWSYVMLSWAARSIRGPVEIRKAA